MGHADYFRLGDANGICDLCGFKFKQSELHKTWDNKMVCKKDWEIRHPQDFVRVKGDKQTIPNQRIEPAWAAYTTVDPTTYPSGIS